MRRCQIENEIDEEDNEYEDIFSHLGKESIDLLKKKLLQNLTNKIKM